MILAILRHLRAVLTPVRDSGKHPEGAPVTKGEVRAAVLFLVALNLCVGLVAWLIF